MHATKIAPEYMRNNVVEEQWHFSLYYTLGLKEKNITLFFHIGVHVKRGNFAATISRLPKCVKTPKQIGTCNDNPNHNGELCKPCLQNLTGGERDGRIRALVGEP